MKAVKDTNQNHEGLNLELSLRPPSPPSLRGLLRSVVFPTTPTPPQPTIPHPFTSSYNLSPTPTAFPATPASPQPVIPHPFTSSDNLSPLPMATNSQSNLKRPKRELDNMSINPPYPWATGNRGVIHELEYLRSNHILTITGNVKCNRCDEKYTMEYDLLEKFDEVASFIGINKNSLHDRAPSCWMDPILPDCNICGQKKCVKPVILENDDHMSINWLFLLLGQFLGCLKHEQLKNLCAQTNNHRTGAKDRLLYLTYLALCKQLQPSNKLFHYP